MARPRQEPADSVVAEMTPRSHPGSWTAAKLNNLIPDEGAPPYVRVTGWLLLDSEHLTRPGGPRATQWEIHPVTRFEVCKGQKRACDQGRGWKPLEDMSEETADN